MVGKTDSEAQHSTMQVLNFPQGGRGSLQEVFGSEMFHEGFRILKIYTVL